MSENIKVLRAVHGIAPRSDELLTLGTALEKGRVSQLSFDEQVELETENWLILQRSADIDIKKDGKLRWHDHLRPIVRATQRGFKPGIKLGLGAAHRPAYKILNELKKHNPYSSVGLGVTSVHEDYLEPPELIRDRVLWAGDLLGNPSKVYPSPDCGLRTRSWSIAYEKLSRTIDGTNLAKQELGV